MGDRCFEHSVSAAHFQLKIRRYYYDGARPPLREAFFIVTLPVPYQRGLLLECPGLVVMSHLLVAEVRLYTHSLEEAAELAERARIMMELPELAGPHMEGLQKAWPMAAGWERYYETARRMEEAHHKPMTVDLVIPHCREDLGWLASTDKLEVLPSRTRIFIYEKCGGPIEGQDILNISAQLGKRAQVLKIPLEDAADPSTGLAARRDECTAYLVHVVRNWASNALADLTLFLHGDPGDHTPFGFLNLVLRGAAFGTLRNISFLHLGSPRLVHTANPCQDALFEAAIGRKLSRPLSTYCCSQFAVSKERIRERPREQYENMLRLVDGSVRDGCERIGPAYEKYVGQRLSHCYFFEFMWHVVFGESEELALRADDSSLPVALRLKDNEQDLPSTWSSYLSSAVSGHTSFSQQHLLSWRQQITESHDLGPKQQLHYGDMVTA